MKAILKVLSPLLLAIILTACSEDATQSVETSLIYIKTVFAETQSALPTNTAAPSPLPTMALPKVTITPDVPISSDFVHPPLDRLDYAMSIAPKVYNHLPYIGEFSPLGGEYNGCVDSNDFNNVVYYGIEHPLDTTTSAFDKYFQQENWAFTEATTELVGDEIKVPQVSYDVYRISQNETPAFERLKIALRDESSFRGKDYIDVRLVLTHIETKNNIQYLQDFYCGINKHWLWIHLNK